MVTRSTAYLRSLRYDLPPSVYVLQGGLIVNAFGNGAANPFLVLYLHDVRHISLAVAGLVSATGAGCSLASALAAGSIADRYGQRATMIGGLLCSTSAFALYPLVREPWHAFALASLAGTGIGSWLTMQSSLVATITPAAVRHAAFAQQRVAANVGLGLGGFAGGLIVATTQPRTFTTLFLLNAGTFLVYTLVLLRLRLPPRPAMPLARGLDYRDVARDGVFMRFAALNFLFVAGAISLLNGLFPVYARNEARLSEDVIGGLFLLNALVIITFQLPTARAIEGRRRMRAFALMGAHFAACWLLVAAGGTFLAGVAVVVLGLAILSMSLAECLYDSVQGALVADLARPGLIGRYMAVTGFSWQLGFIVGPGLGGFLLGAEPVALWLVAASLCLLGGLYALVLERRLPNHALRTPLKASTAQGRRTAAALSGPPPRSPRGKRPA